MLTILGVIMYLREGWVVGQAGLGGAVLIILLTFLITGTAALSLSSITTNIRMGAGGVFYIISQSLGLEPGGSIGIPLYLGQALSAALYIYGFSEAWLYLFPDHPQLLVAYGVFAVVFTATLISTRLAFRLQGLVMFVILVSLGSIVLGLTGIGRQEPLHNPQLWGPFDAGGFWVLFAIFFPAGTGIKVGASMSGALADPRRSIPRGTLAAVGTALVVYLFMALWYSLVATPEELRSNYLVVVERAARGELVLAGILASTFTATLSSLVAAPRVLHALGEQGIIPRRDFFGRLTPGGEPRNAALVTGGLVGLALLLGSLDRIAVLITMFYLLTYLTIDLVILVEQGLGMISFRPLFRIPLWVPMLGIAACLLAIFVISPAFALIALTLVAGIYVYLTNRKLQTPWQTVRSSIFVSLADWAAKRIARTPEEANERSWKPDLLVPVTSRSQLDGTFRFLRVLTEPKGSLKIVGVRCLEEAPETLPAARTPESSPGTPAGTTRPDDLDTLPEVARMFQQEGVYATATVIEAPSLAKGVQMSAAVLRGSYFRPNVLFGLAHLYAPPTLQHFVDTAAAHQMGVALLYLHPEAGLGYEHRLNVWVRDQSPTWQLGLRLANLDLTVLLAYQIFRNWRGRELRLLTVCEDPQEVPNARAYLRRLVEDARLPPGAVCRVYTGRFLERLAEAPRADVQLLGLPREVDPAFLKTVVFRTRSSCLFVRDSGRESALA
ncbi:Na-K-Cl cotransporter [Rhodocaloribacter litoris]|uniref:amino acid permease n=1 Tax=Rhodocaloribacter litoris TaxID=2558931 RepID=UPI0021D445BD|nr:amino acid permease [Rhodocaloribacter litoris]QXD16915.1 Na-K-Cl cotransporter [Rhodocaloribacter litoris]